jgi:flagellar assembly protein FliH
MAKFTVHTDYPVKGVRIAIRGRNPEVREYSENMLTRVVELENRKTHDEFQQTLEEERKKAYDQGFEEGSLQSEQHCLKEFGKSFQILRKITEAFHRDVAELIDREEQEMLHLVIAIARKVVDLEVQTNPDTVLTVLKRALNLLNDRRSIRIHVNPADWTTVQNSLAGLNLKVELPRDVEVVSSTHIAPGGCLVDSASGSIDADLETQFEEIRRKLLKDDIEIS